MLEHILFLEQITEIFYVPKKNKKTKNKNEKKKKQNKTTNKKKTKQKLKRKENKILYDRKGEIKKRQIINKEKRNVVSVTQMFE